MRAPKTIVMCLFCIFPLSCTQKPAVESAAGAVPDTKGPSGMVEKDFGALVLPGDVADGSEWEFGKARLPNDAADAAKNPLGIEAYFQLKFVAAPQWSPGAERVLFSVNSKNIKEGTSTTNLYLASADGKAVRQMTSTEGHNYGHRWSPDGSNILFLSDREESVGMFVMPSDGGEPRALRTIPTGVSSPAWLPDGKHVAFVSEVYPEHGGDLEKNKQLMDDIEKSPMKAHVAEHLLFRHWDHYRDGRRRHVLVMNIESGEVKDLTPGDFDSPTFSIRGEQPYDISKDGREMAFSSNREQADAQAWTTNSDIWVVSTDGGKPLNITEGNKAWDGGAIYSPDGRFISYLRQQRPGLESDMIDICLYDRKSGDVTVLTEKLDFQVSTYAWTADGKRLVVKLAEAGRYPLYTIDVDSGVISRVTHLPSVKDYDIAPNGKHLAFTFDKIGQPVELFVSGIDDPKSIRLTGINDAVVDEYDIRPAEEIWLDGTDGKKVHTYIVKPHGFEPGKKYPLILNVHGGPQMQWSDRMRGDWQIYPAHGYVVAFPNPHGSTGYGQDYTDAISKDWNGKVIADVMKVSEQLAALDFVDAERMGAMGWSWGGYAMNWIMGQEHPFKAFASMMGMFDMDSMYYSTEELWFPEADLGQPWVDKESFVTQSPSSYVENFKTPTLIITGEKDYRIPYTQNIMLFTALRRRGVPAKIMIFPNDGHWPDRVKSMPLYYTAHLEWFHRYLGGAAPAHDLQQMIRGRAFD